MATIEKLATTYMQDGKGIKVMVRKVIKHNQCRRIKPERYNLLSGTLGLFQVVKFHNNESTHSK